MPGRRNVVETADRGAIAELLRGRLAESVESRAGTSICLIGPAGMGKSHLVRSLIADVGVTSLRAAGDHRRRNQPFAVLEQLTGPVPAGEDPAEVVFDRIDERCAAGPLVVWVDDAHHADAASLAGLRRLVWAGRSLPLSVVISARPHPVPEQLELVLRQVETVAELPPMDRMMTERLVHDRTGRWPGPRLRAALDAAGGNPLFVSELLRQVGGGLREVGSDTVDLTEGSSIRGEVLDALIRGHLADLDETSSEVLQALSVWGTAAATDDLAEVLYTSADALEPALDRAVRAGVAVADTPDGTVDFAHDLFREVTYSAMPGAVRRRMHRRVAAVLTDRGAGPGIVAEHLLQASADRAASGPDAELLAALNAAVEASGQYAPQVSADLLEVAEGVAGPAGAGAEQLVLHRAGELFRSGRGAAAERLVLDRIGGVRDPAVAAGLQRVLITSQINRGDVDGALISIGRTLAIERLPPPVRRGLAAQRQWLLLLDGRFGLLDDQDAMVAEARAAGDLPPQATLLLVEALLAYVRGDSHRARQIITTQIDLQAQYAQGPLAASTFMVWPAMFELDIAGPAAAQRELAKAREIAAESQWVVPFLGFVAAGAAWAAGDWDGAVAEADAALESAEETGTGWTSITVGERIDIDARRGQVRAARKRLDEFRSRRLPHQFGRGDIDLAEMAILEAEGAIDAAVAQAEAYWTRVRTQPGMGGIEFAVDIVRLGLIGLRPPLVEQVVQDVDRLPAAYRPPGVLELIRGAARSDRAEIERARAAFAERGFVGRVVHALEELACAAAAAGDRSAAAAAMEEAIAGYERMRSTVDRDRLLARMRALGIRRGSRQAHRSQTAGWDSLTATERRITDLICDGLTNREIAARLYISPRTVQSHVSHVLEKTGLRSRVEVAAAAPR